MIQKISFWDIPLAVGSPVELAQYARRRLSPRKAFFIATPNPEIMLLSRRDRLLQAILKATDMNIIDGAGLAWALRRRSGLASGGGSDPPRQARNVAGVDFMEILLTVLPHGQQVLCFGGTKRSVTLAARQLSRRFPQHTFAAVPGEIPAVRGLSPLGQRLARFKTGPRLLAAIRKIKPTVLFAGLGAPLQEKWLAANLSRFKTVRLAMGVGGAFDLLSGSRPRAPRWLRRLGLEWGWRLIQQPQRLMRILRAVVVFPISALATRYSDTKIFTRRA